MTEQFLTAWCVIPSFWDIPSFLQLRANVLDLFAKQPALAAVTPRFLLIDDSAGEDPATAELQNLADVRVLTPPHSLGHQRAIVFGLRTIRESVMSDDFVITMDADGEDRPCDLPVLLHELQEAEHQGSSPIVLAQRTTRHTTLRFKLLYFCFRGLFAALTGKTIRSGNFACFRGRVLQRIIRHPFFDVSYSSALVAYRAVKRYVPCPRGKRYAGQSKMNTHELVVHGLRMLMPFLDSITIRALFAAAVVFALTCLMAAKVLLEILQQHAVSAPSMLLLGFGFIAATVLFSQFLLLFSLLSKSDAMTLQDIDNGESEPGREP